MVTVDTRVEPWTSLKLMTDQINSSDEPDSLLRASLIAVLSMINNLDFAEISQAVKYSLDFLEAEQNSSLRPGGEG